MSEIPQDRELFDRSGACLALNASIFRTESPFDVDISHRLRALRPALFITKNNTHKPAFLSDLSRMFVYGPQWVSHRSCLLWSQVSDLEKYGYLFYITAKMIVLSS